MNARLRVIAQRAASSLDTLQSSYDLARLAIQNDVPGDFVECGVFAGAQCAAMALALKDEIVLSRRIHLFDSFEGVPSPGEHDQQWKEAGHPKGQSCASLHDVRSNMKEWKIDERLLLYHVGDFADTVPMFQRTIAILRLDGDLYESTKVCIKHLYPLVSPGGWIIADDFGLDGARKAVLEFMGGGAKFGPVMWQKEF